jgi:hypothetical protein
LLTLPIRAGTGATKLALRVTGRAAGAAGRALGLVRPAAAAPPEAIGRSGAASPRRSAARSRRASPAAEPTRAAAPAAAETAHAPAPAPAEGSPAAAEGSATAAGEPPTVAGEPPTPIGAAANAKTVDDEPVPVGEFAEQGAEDGAGAQLTIDEPWEGYDALTSEELSARIAAAGAEELALIELYERAHKGRQAVLQAAEIRLNAISGRATESAG